MIPVQFDYAAPATLDEALALLQKGAGARIIAGGQELMTQMKLRKATPTSLVDLRRIRGLSGIAQADGSLTIGALATCARIAADPAVLASAQALAEAADSIGDAQVRNSSTIGGNLAYGDPAADLPAALLVLEAVVHITGASGSRTIPIDQFLQDAHKTALRPDEIITAIELPLSQSVSGSAYLKFRNPANGYPICGVAARVVPAPRGSIYTVCRLAVTGVTAHPQRLPRVETAIEGRAQFPETIAAACARAGEGLTFTTDLYAAGDYRSHLTSVLAARAIARAAERAKARQSQS